VLLVEDNPTDVFVIKEALDASGLKLDVRIVSDGQDALRYLQLAGTGKAPCPALILLDLNIPKVAGIEVLRHLRTNSRCRHTPVIVVTSSTAETDRAAVERFGAEAYFQKPKNLAAYMELAPLVKNVLNPSGS
jgi:CheY-like chemotaxis protein